MSLTDLKSFNAVARYGGFVKAAEQLLRAQPTVTVQVRNLEKNFGVELFYRGRGQTAKLTPFGVQLYETTQQLFNLERDANTLLESAGNAQGGFLRLGAISPRCALPIMTQVSRDLPGLELSLRIDNSQALLRAVLNHDLDICFVGLHETNSRYFTQKISAPEIVLAASPDHPNAEKGIISRSDFAQQTLLQREPGSETRALTEADFQLHDYAPARTLEIGGRESVLLAVQNGLGIAPVSLEEVGTTDPIRILRCADFRTHGEIHIACLANRLHIPIVKSIFAIERNKTNDLR